MSSIEEDLDSIEKQMIKAVANTAWTLHADLKVVAPVGTPETTGIKGYVGGTFRDAWKLKRQGTLSWLISNHVEYASYLWRGHSKQWNGGDGMVLKADRKLQQKFNLIRA